MQVYIVQHWYVEEGTEVVIAVFSDYSSAREFAARERAKLTPEEQFAEGISIVVHTLDFQAGRLFNE